MRKVINLNFLTPEVVMRSAGFTVLIFLLLLIPAGRWDYWQGWMVAGLNAVQMLLNAWVLRSHPDLVRERMTPGKGRPRWDKVYTVLVGIMYFSHLVVAGLDAGRFGWSGSFPIWLYLLSFVLFAAGNALMLWAKITNRWFSSVVRLQPDRDQMVCKEGPYRIIRHPGYLGGLVFMLSGAVLLGSWYAVGLQAIACALLVYRTAREDRFLRSGLPGYGEYAEAIRYRLLPGIW